VALRAGADCNLGVVYPAKATLQNPVQMKADVVNVAGIRYLRAQFLVHTPNIYARRELGPGQYPYMFDVVELFVADSADAVPYSEFELSPYGQTFQVRIVAGQPFQNGVDLGLKSSVQIMASGWSGEILVPIDPAIDPSTIVGNAYGVFGQAPRRSFWSAFPMAGPDSHGILPKPDFHQPKYFAPLMKCGGA
jgi:hypothetical protein